MVHSNQKPNSPHLNGHHVPQDHKKEGHKHDGGDAHSKKHHHDIKIKVEGKEIETSEFHGNPWDGRVAYHTHIKPDDGPNGEPDGGPVRHYYVLGSEHHPEKEEHFWFSFYPIGEVYVPMSSVQPNPSSQVIHSERHSPSSPPTVPTVPTEYQPPPPTAPTFQETQRHSPTYTSPLLQGSMFAQSDQSQTNEASCCPPLQRCTIL